MAAKASASSSSQLTEASSPGNKLPVYFLSSLWDARHLSPIGAIESRPVLQRSLTAWHDSEHQNQKIGPEMLQVS
jgi:hypothetical protein